MIKKVLLAISKIPRPFIRYIWMQATINQINHQNQVLPCPYCKSTSSRFIHRWKISNHFGLFDKSHVRLQIIYADSLFGKLPVFFKNYYRDLFFSWISDIAFVDYRRCTNCDLVFQNYPHTRESANYYYSTLYRIPYSTTNADGNDIYGRSDARIINQHHQIGEFFIKRTGLQKGAKIIDVGCAEGNTCKYLEEQGYLAYGIESSIQMTNYAKEILSLKNITCDSYNPTSYGESFFDGIISHHVVEHIVDLENFFTGFSRHLKRGGFLLIQVPCLDTLKSECDYNLILQGGHIYGFSESFLRTVIEKGGFKIIEMKMTPCDLNELDASEKTSWNTSCWADDPCGISILAVKI